MKEYARQKTNIGEEACLIDGLTLQNAADILQIKDNVPDDILKNLVPIQLVSLAHVVQALVSYEKIITLPSHTTTWSGNVHLKRALSGNVIRFPEISPKIEKQLEVISGQKMIELARSHIFRKFTEDLTSNCVEGIVLEIARHYHGFGGRIFTYFRRHDTVEGIDEVIQKATWSEVPRSAISWAAALFGTGAFHYRNLGTYLNVPYSPFCLRAPFCIYDDTRYGPSPVAGAKIAMRILKNEVMTAIQPITEQVNSYWLEMDFPPIFTYVLRQARNRAEILPCALAIRETPEAKNFRRDMGKLTAALNTGNVPSMVLSYTEFKKKITEIFQTGEVTPRLKVKINFTAFEAELPIKMPEFLRNLLQKKTKRTTLYHLLMAELPTIWQLRNDIRRLFGLELDPKIGDMYDKVKSG